MRIVDSSIDQRKDDAGASFRHTPGLGRVNVSPRSPTVLPSIVEIPLLGELRVVREGHTLNRMDDIVRLGVKNIRLRPIVRDGLVDPSAVWQANSLEMRDRIESFQHLCIYECMHL